MLMVTYCLFYFDQRVCCLFLIVIFPLECSIITHKVYHRNTSHIFTFKVCVTVNYVTGDWMLMGGWLQLELGVQLLTPI